MKINFICLAKKIFLTDGVYWSSISRLGCPTQLKNCFNNSIPQLDSSAEAFPYPTGGGSCVAIIVNALLLPTQPKVANCDAQLPMACEGKITEVTINQNVNLKFQN